MSQRETSIDYLDSIETRKVVEEIENINSDEKIKSDANDSVPLEPESEIGYNNSWKEAILNPDTAILSIILLIFLHPGVNSILNNNVKLGGFTFIAKTSMIVILYTLFKYFI